MRFALLLLLALASCGVVPKPINTAAFYPPPPFCTRTLGMASCFAEPAALPDHPVSWGDTPYRPVQPPVPVWKRVASYWND